MPLVKSRGLGSSSSAAGPLPSPLSPWQPAHLRSYTALPAVASPACPHAPLGTAQEITTVVAITIEPKVRSKRERGGLGGHIGAPQFKWPPDFTNAISGPPSSIDQCAACSVSHRRGCCPVAS